MANFKSYNQGRPGMGNPYEGTGFTNLDNFLNQGNLDWGNAQSQAPGPMDLAQGRTQPEAGFERWMYGATTAPQQNALKEERMPGLQSGEQPDTAKMAQPKMWNKDNVGWKFDQWKWDREMGPMINPDPNSQGYKDWVEKKKEEYFNEFKQGQHEEDAGGTWNNGIKTYPSTQEKKFSNLDKFLGW